MINFTENDVQLKRVSESISKRQKVEQIALTTRIEVPLFLVSIAEALSGQMSSSLYGDSYPGWSLVHQKPPSHTHYFRGCLQLCPTNLLDHQAGFQALSLYFWLSKFILGPLLSTWKTPWTGQCIPNFAHLEGWGMLPTPNQFSTPDPESFFDYGRRLIVPYLKMLFLSFWWSWILIFFLLKIRKTNTKDTWRETMRTQLSYTYNLSKRQTNHRVWPIWSSDICQIAYTMDFKSHYKN